MSFHRAPATDGAYVEEPFAYGGPINHSMAGGIVAQSAVKPTGFFDRLANERNISLKHVEQIEVRLLNLAAQIGAPQYPPAEPLNGLSSPSAQCVEKSDDEVTRALDSARELSNRLDFLLGLAGRIAERL